MTYLTAAYQMYLGIKQHKDAKKINDTRPTYRIPNEIGQNVKMYNDLSMTNRLPGQSQMEDDINANTANSLAQIDNTGGSSVNRLATIAAVNQTGNSAFNDLNVAGAQFRQGNIDKLAGANEMMANYRDQAFDYNKNQEFQYRRMKKNMLEQASQSNIYNSGVYAQQQHNQNVDNIQKVYGMAGGMGGK